MELCRSVTMPQCVAEEASDECFVTALSDSRMSANSNDKPGCLHRSFSAQTDTCRDERRSSVALHPMSAHFLSSLRRREDGDAILVVVPSMDLDELELARMTKNVAAYESRQLYYLLLLKHPGVRVVFVSSEDVSPSVVGYYLTLREGRQKTADLHNELSRLYMLPFCGRDSTSAACSLSRRLLARPPMMCLIRYLVNSQDRCIRVETPTSCQGRGNAKEEDCSRDARVSYFFNRQKTVAGLAGFTGSSAMDRLSKEIGMRLLEAGAENLYWGTKQGSRELFRSCGIPICPGTPNDGDDDLLLPLATGQCSSCSWTERQRYIRTPRALATGLGRQILACGCRPRQWMVKLNMGFSGIGNATLDLQEVQQRSYSHVSDNADAQVKAIAKDIEVLLPKMVFEDDKLTWDGCNGTPGFIDQLARLGAIAEVFLEDEVQRSPSVQGVVDPNGNDGAPVVQILSTHEQVLRGQIYQGCINPASLEYRDRLLDYGYRIGTELAARGVVGHFSADFLASRRSATAHWEIIAIEINLRCGGTTHPYSTMDLLIEGSLGRDGMYYTKSGKPRCYVATDAFQSVDLVGMTETVFIQAVENHTDMETNFLHWKQEIQIGVVFHMFNFLTCSGRIGFTAIGSSIEEAQELFDGTIQYLENLGRRWKHDLSRSQSCGGYGEARKAIVEAPMRGGECPRIEDTISQYQ